jgi:hypothetical protein
MQFPNKSGDFSMGNQIWGKVTFREDEVEIAFFFEDDLDGDGENRYYSGVFEEEGYNIKLF